MSVLRVVVLAVLLLFSQTYLAQEWLAVLVLLAALYGLGVFLGGVAWAVAAPARRKQ